MHFLSSSFLRAGIILSQKCLDSELAKGQRKRSDLISEHQAYFYGVIFSAASYLEAYINEYYVNFSQCNLYGLKVDSDSLIQIETLWKMDIPRTASFKTLDKYQIMLTLCKKPKFNKSIRPYQDVEILIKLRNSLIHYEPEYIESKFNNPNAQLHRFEKYLTGKIDLNPFATKLDDFYPTKLISYSCCKWALDSVDQFTDDFYRNLTSSAS